MKKSIIYLSITFFIVFNLTNCSKKQSIENYIKELPDDLKPELVKQYPDLLLKDTIDIQTYKTKSDNSVTFKHYQDSGSDYDSQTIDLLPSKDSVFLCYTTITHSMGLDTDPLTGLSGHVEYDYYSFKVYRKGKETWDDVTSTIVPAQVANINNESGLMTIDLSVDSLIITDSYNNLRFGLVWKNNKFNLVTPFPENFGKKSKTDDNSGVAEFVGFWNDFKQALIAKDNAKITGLTGFPFKVVHSFNGATNEVKEFQTDSFFVVLKENFFPEGKYIVDENFKKLDYSPDFLNEAGNKLVYSFGYENSTDPERPIFYFMWMDDSVKFVGMEFQVTGD